jgi:hypothetical protein
VRETEESRFKYTKSTINKYTVIGAKITNNYYLRAEIKSDDVMKSLQRRAIARRAAAIIPANLPFAALFRL